MEGVFLAVVYRQTFEGFVQASTGLNVCLKHYDTWEIYEMVICLRAKWVGIAIKVSM